MRDELEPYDPGGQLVSVNGAIERILRPRQALNFALVLHELATNAAKHGALAAPGGGIDVTWTLADHRDDRQLRLVWRESGGPPVTEPERRGLGSTLIENALRGEAGSETGLDFDPAGVRCIITLRLDDLLPGAAIVAGSVPRLERAGAAPADHVLQGVRVLVVEDETLAGVELRLSLSEAGAEVVGPAASVAEGRKLAAASRPAAAVLDVNLDGERIDALADLLVAEGVPVVFVTRCAETALPPRLRHLRVLQKPIAQATLINSVRELVADPAAPAAAG